ncbi:MAG TPA: hypothetical protein VGM79_15805 [Streptosporangiaceae bacterium]
MVADGDSLPPNPPDRAAGREPRGLEMLGGEAPGGDGACWAHLVCEECGAMTTEGHRPSCSRHAGPTGEGDRTRNPS